MNVTQKAPSSNTGAQFLTLRTKFVLFISLIIVVTCSGLSWYFVQRTTESMTRSLSKTGKILANNLAHNSRYAIFTEDEVLLGQFIDGVVEIEEVVYVVMTGPEGKLLAARSKGTLIESNGLVRSATDPLYPDPSLAMRLLDSASPEPVITTFTLTGNKREPGNETVYDFAVTVIRQDQPQPSVPLLLLESEELEEEALLAHGSTPQIFGVVQVGLTEARMRQALNTIIRNVALLTLLIILLGIAATTALAGRIVTPLKALTGVASRVADGDLTATVEPSTRDEVGQLTRVFNDMTTALQERDRAISSQIETIRRQVRQLNALNQAAAAMTSTLDIDRLRTTVLDILTENVGFSRMLIMLYDSGRHVAYGARTAGLTDAVARAAHDLETPVHDDGSLLSQVLIHGKPILVTDLAGVADRMPPLLFEMTRHIGVVSFVCAPLKSKERVLGYLAADRGNEQCTQEDLDLLITIANDVAVAMDNAEAYQQLEALNVGLEAKVRERTAELETANTRLREMDRLKTDFFANISHELRTPLTLSLGTYKMLLTLSPTSESQELIHSGLRNTSRLLFLINELLDLAKFESGHAELRKRCIDLAALVRSVAANFESSARRHVHFRGVDRPIAIEADPRQMKKLLYNLLSNAFKFADPNEGQVWIRVSMRGDCIELEIEDNGIGIPSDQLAKIFDRFTQVEASARRRYEGSGIGLALVKEIVTLHGGRIAVESEVNRGSTFTITLPRGEARSEDIVTVEDDDTVVLPLIAGTGEERTPGATPPPGASGDVPLVLVADDNADMRIYLERVLRKKFRVVLTGDGAEALEQAKAARPDLILTDAMMPRMSGYDLLKAVRNDDTLRAIPVIFLTALAATDARVESLEAGADDYIPKPFDEHEVLARVNNLIRFRAQERALFELQKEKLVRFLPPHLAEMILSGSAEEFLRGHRAEITVLFIDLRGFTAFSETAEPEDVMTVLREYQAEMGRIVAEYQGTLERFSGDSMMIFFNDPIPVQNHAEQAGRMGLALLQRIAELETQWSKRGFDLGAGIGIATGYATLGAIGFEGRQDYAAIGTVSNLAARLCGEAQRGQILVSGRFLELVQNLFSAEPIGSLSLKGFIRPVPAYNITGLRSRSVEE